MSKQSLTFPYCFIFHGPCSRKKLPSRYINTLQIFYLIGPSLLVTNLEGPSMNLCLLLYQCPFSHLWFGHFKQRLLSGSTLTKTYQSIYKIWEFLNLNNHEPLAWTKVSPPFSVIYVFLISVSKSIYTSISPRCRGPPT